MANKTAFFNLKNKYMPKNYAILVSFNYILFKKSYYSKVLYTWYLKKKYYFSNMNEDIIKIQPNPNVIKEGKAEILEPPERKVFYNPVQEFNRDLSVLSLHVFSNQFLQEKNNSQLSSNFKKPFRILEALSATGLRSIRYAKEVPNVTQVIANDISEHAIHNMTANIKHNQVEDIVKISHSNAISLMYNHSDIKERFEAVDLDPYGSPTQFLDSAVQCVADGGMLLVTCTDMAILCGNFPETSYVKYGGISLKCPAQHEMAIRIVLQNIQSHASRYKRYIVPLLAVSVDFYIRIFLKIYTSALHCKNVTSNLSMVFHCTSCDAMTLQPLGITKKSKDGKGIKHLLPMAPPVGMKCIHCNGNHHMGGPIWSGPIHNELFVSEMLKSEKLMELKTSKRLVGLLSMIKEELNVPLYYDTSKLSSVLKSSTIPIMTMRSAILNGNYRVSYSHACKSSIKTDAPMSFIWDIMRQWIKDNPVNLKNIGENSPAYYLLKQPVQHEIDFSLRPDANPLSREKKLTRFQENPMPYWGPGTKSRTLFLEENPKKLKNQNRKRFQKKKLDFETPSKERKTDENASKDALNSQL